MTWLIANYCTLIANVFNGHTYLKQSSKLSENDKEKLQSILSSKQTRGQ